jgi:hypothetical protein
MQQDCQSQQCVGEVHWSSAWRAYTWLLQPNQNRTMVHVDVVVLCLAQVSQPVVCVLGLVLLQLGRIDISVCPGGQLGSATREASSLRVMRRAFTGIRHCPDSHATRIRAATEAGPPVLWDCSEASTARRRVHDGSRNPVVLIVGTDGSPSCYRAAERAHLCDAFRQGYMRSRIEHRCSSGFHS